MIGCTRQRNPSFLAKIVDGYSRLRLTEKCMPKCLYCNVEYIAGALYCDSCWRRLPQPTNTATPPPKVPSELPAGSQKPGRDPTAQDEDAPEKPGHLRLQLIQAGVIFDLGE